MVNVVQIIQNAIQSGIQTDIGIINFVREGIQNFLQFCGKDFMIYSGIPTWAILLTITIAIIGKYFQTVDDSKLNKVIGKLSQTHPKLYKLIIYSLATSVLVIVII